MSSETLIKLTIPTRSVLFIVLFFKFCATNAQTQDADIDQDTNLHIHEITPDQEQGPVSQQSDQHLKDEKCIVEFESDEWIDRMRGKTHHRVCRSVLWVDSLFGNEHEFNDENFRGKVSLGFREDEADGFDPKLRVRIRTKLPNVSNKLNAFIGRVEEDSYISNTEVNEGSISEVGLRSTNDDEDEWLIGLGYRNPRKDSNGFDFSVGAKISSGLQGYAKLAHRHLFTTSERNSWRTTQTLFWQRDDRFGVSSRLDFTHILDEDDILEWDTSLKYTEVAKRTEWVTSGIWHHSFSSKKGISSRAYVRGETERPVDIPEFGLTFTYLTPFLRPWFYVETGIDFRWEKEIPKTEYQSVIRFSLQFQMLLGDYYGTGQ